MLRHIIAFSGGKDSTALLCWAIDKGLEFTAVFCDTGWEHKLTYDYIDEINRKLLNGKLVRLKSERFVNGMTDLVQIKKRVPSALARFCTEHLKIKPMEAYLKAIDDDLIVYQGIRADESRKRALMKAEEWSDEYDAWVKRPLFHWTAEECFALTHKHGLQPNPLYKLGARRVGCFPCVLITLGELRRVRQMLPEVWDRASHLEQLVGGRSFFPPNYIPKRFHSGVGGNGNSYPTLDDVRAYVESKDGEEIKDEPVPQCMSIYNLCE